MRANCKRVEAAEGDLDGHFAADGLNGVLARLALGTTRIRVDGDRDRVFSSLKTAVSLYERFCRTWPLRGRPTAPPAVTNTPVAPAPSLPRSRRPRAQGVAEWPAWEQPADADVLALARALTPLVRFLHPEVVRAVVEDNERHRDAWSAALVARGVDAGRYLWPRSACAFPGVRRHAGKAEIERFRDRAPAKPERPVQAVRIDDNTYAKHLWSYVLRGRPFQQHGPVGYELGHLLDHKGYKNRFAMELCGGEALAGCVPFGLYTCASNTVFVPRSLLRPTDHAGALRGLLQRRAVALYGTVCNLVPPPVSVQPAAAPGWEADSFAWAEPVATREPVERFLAWRRERVEALLRGDLA
jgi:hypothetical protein